MAVPFSRPAYPRPPRRNQTNQNQNQVQNQHPITRFLDGRGNINLDQLSLTSRIAFYALYEAYRLLMDLTNGGQQQQQQRPQQQQQRQQHTVVNTPAQHQQESQHQNIVLPDIVPDSTQFRVRTPRVVSCQQSQQQQQSDKVNHEPSFNYPDLIPTIEEEDEPDFCKSGFVPDLISGSPGSPGSPGRDDLLNNKFSHYQKRSVSTSSDYYSLDGSQLEDYQSALLEEDDESCDKLNEKCDDNSLIFKGVNWRNLGDQLCEIASAFEVTYAPAMNDQQRQVYQIYRDLKLRTLAVNRRDHSMIGLSKTICTQVLLSTIWILLKKIM